MFSVYIKCDDGLNWIIGIIVCGNPCEVCGLRNETLVNCLVENRVLIGLIGKFI